MELHANDLLLKTVTADDIEEVARMWETKNTMRQQVAFIRI